MRHLSAGNPPGCALEPALGALSFKLAQPSGIGYLHAPLLGASLLEGGITESALTADFPDRQPGLGLLGKANDLCIAESAGLHTHYFPGG